MTTINLKKLLFFCFLLPSLSRASVIINPTQLSSSTLPSGSTFYFGSGPVVVKHIDGTTTVYLSTENTNQNRGGVLILASTSSVNGDSLYLSSGTFNIGTNYINGGSVFGSGKYATIIQGQSGGRGTGIMTSSNTIISDLTLEQNVVAAAPDYWFPINSSAPATNISIRHVNIVGQTDGVFMSPSVASIITGRVEDLTCRTNFDCFLFDSPGGTMNVYDSDLATVNNGASTVSRAYYQGRGTSNLYNTRLNSFDKGGYVDSSGILNINGGQIDGHNQDLNNSAGTINVTPNTVFNSTNTVGTITTPKPLKLFNTNLNYSTLQVFGTGNGGGATVGQIVWGDQGTGNSLGVLSSLGNGYSGAFFLIGDSLNAPFGEISEFDILDRQLQPADARIAFTVGRIDNSGGFRYDIGIRNGSGSIFIPFGITPTGTIFGNTVDGIEPSAYVHILAGIGSSGTAPLKIDPGTFTPTPEQGAFETNGSGILYYSKNTSNRDKFGFTTSSDTITSTQTHQNDIDLIGSAKLTSNGQQIGLQIATYAALGTPFTLTTTTNTINVGTSSMTITLTSSGTYNLNGFTTLFENGSTFASNDFVTLHIYRQNNTPGKVSNSQVWYETSVSVSALTATIGQIQTPPDLRYTTTNANDVLSLQIQISAAPGAGSVQAKESGLVATRIF